MSTNRSREARGRATKKTKKATKRKNARKKTSKKTKSTARKKGSHKKAALERDAKTTRRKRSSSRSSDKNGAEPTAERKKRARRILSGLQKLYPEVECALVHDSAFQLLIATILSAQSTDNNVNKVTPRLFDEYPTPGDLAEADPEAVEDIIRSTGFFRQKRKSIQGAAQRVVEDFGGQVPDTLEELTQLPGVARKTANVVLGTWFGKNEGVVVDTHVGRLAHRLGLTWSSRDSKDAVRIERDLVQVIPRPQWTYVSHALIWHGRLVCTARKPKCEECALAPDCPSAFQF